MPTLRILIAEDVITDAELAVAELKRAGLVVTHRIVDTPDEYARALRQFSPDIILSDFTMPAFDGMHALRTARDLAPEIPFIFVSGTLGEEYAIRALKAGATDYVVKPNLRRLPATIERALAEAEILREQRRINTELEIARERLEEREAGLRRAQQMARLAHFITKADGSFERWSDSLAPLIGVTPPRSTRAWLDLIHPADVRIVREKAIDAARAQTHAEVEYRLRRADGSWIHIRQTMEPLQAQRANGEEQRWFNTVQDISDLKGFEERIKRLNRVHAVLSGINSLIVRVTDRDELFKEACRVALDAGQFSMVWIGVVDEKANAVKPVAWAGNVGNFFEVASLPATESTPRWHALADAAIRSQMPVISNDVQNDPQRLMKREYSERGINSLAVIPLLRGSRAIGVLCFYAADINCFDDEEMRLLLELAGDVAFAFDHMDKVEKIAYLSQYDPITDFANRALFLERLTQKIEAAAAAGRSLAIWLADIDRFKAINDALGRQVGDELLRKIAQRILTVSGDATRLARVGGDQFAGVSSQADNEDDVARLAERRLQEWFGQAYKIGEHEFGLSAHMGIAMFPNDGGDAETLLRSAEAAVKKAKASGDRYLFHTREMTERIAEKLSLETKLRRAFEKNEFVLHYQPKVDLRRREIVGVEALIRWQSPELGLVPPMKFIPLLEETGLILEVGSWALARAARDRLSWIEKKLDAPRIAVNVSSIQLRQRNFVDIVQRAISEVPEPAGIDLEITESVVMEDIQVTTEKLRAAKQLGVRIGIDDFGTGYSSLAYLAKLPVEVLKVDRSFIDAMLNDRDRLALVHTIIALAHSLRLIVVAEGVETEDQAAKLLELGCDQMQGYLVSKPLPNALLEDLLRR